MELFLKKFTTNHNTAPFCKIKLSDYKVAFEKTIALARNEISNITNNIEAPTFQNTIEALDYSGEQLDRLSSIFFNLNSAETCDEMQKIAQEVSPLLTEFSNDIALNEELFKRVKAVYDQKDILELTTEQATLLDKKFKGFSRNGALLSEEDKLKLREIDTELAKLKLTFGENVLAETNNYQLHITNEADLKGLPDGTKEMAASLAKSKNLEGWIFTLDFPSYLPFVTYVENRELRKEIAIAAGKKSFQDNEFDNKENVKRIVELRHKRANLLGYQSHSHFVLEERMAQNPEKVQSFLNDLLEKAKPAAHKEFAELTAFAAALDGIDQLEKWDGAYYSEKLKQKLFSLDDELLKPYFKLENVLNGAFTIAEKLFRSELEKWDGAYHSEKLKQKLFSLDDELLKPYFKLENVLNGAFTIAEKLFGITFKEVIDIDKYHEDVQTFEVLDFEGKLVAIFYSDFFPRKGKRNGAWMTSYKPQYIKDGINERPHVSIVCNFTPPTDTKPSLF